MILNKNTSLKCPFFLFSALLLLPLLMTGCADTAKPAQSEAQLKKKFSEKRTPEEQAEVGRIAAAANLSRQPVKAVPDSVKMPAEIRQKLNTATEQHNKMATGTVPK